MKMLQQVIFIGDYYCNSTDCYTLNDFLIQSAGASYNVNLC